MSSLLTDKQRQELNLAVVDYLSSINVSSSTLDALRNELFLTEETSESQKGLPLEKKWTAVVALQRQVLELKSQLKQVQISASETPTQSGIWLPKLPPKHTLMGHRQPIVAIACHPVWSVVVTASEDGTIKVWDSESGDLERTIKAHTRGVLDVDFGKNKGPQSILASCSSDLSIKIWDPKNEYANIKTLIGHDHSVSAVCVLPPDDQLLASASRDKTVRIWQLDTGYCIRVIKGHSDWVRALSPSHDGAFIVSAGSDMTARICSTGDAAIISGSSGISASNSLGGNSNAQLVFSGHTHVIECTAVAPQSALANLAKLEGLPAPSPDEKVSLSYFATGSRDKTIIIWNMRQQPIIQLNGHDNWVRGLVFDPNGRFLFSVSDDKTLRTWDLANGGRQVRPVVAHDHFVSCISSGGPRMLATGSIDLSAKIWR